MADIELKALSKSFGIDPSQQRLGEVIKASGGGWLQKMVQ